LILGSYVLEICTSYIVIGRLHSV